MYYDSSDQTYNLSIINFDSSGWITLNTYTNWEGHRQKIPYLDVSTGRPNVDPCKIDWHID